jgi:hypothetical protein
MSIKAIPEKLSGILISCNTVINCFDLLISILMFVMSEGAGPSGNEASGHDTPSRADVVKCLIDYKDFFADINIHPEGDVRHRFLAERAKRARYVESVVLDRWNDLIALEQDIGAGNADPEDEECLGKYHRAMAMLDKALTWLSKPTLRLALSSSCSPAKVVCTRKIPKLPMRQSPTVTSWTMCFATGWRILGSVIGPLMESCDLCTVREVIRYHKISWPSTTAGMVSSID